MAYATTADVSARYGNALIDAYGDNASASIEKALDDASGFIDSHLGMRREAVIQTPLLTRFSVDIAVYWLSEDAGLATEEKRQRFDDARNWLAQFSKGLVDLDGNLSDAASQSTTTAAVLTQERLFSRQRLGAW